ncbi:unnamed protein product, partial [Rotaria sp. Silwood2]
MQTIYSNSNIISISYMNKFKQQLNLIIEKAKQSQANIPIFPKKKLDRLKTITNERHERKLRKFLAKLQTKYEDDLEQHKQRKTFHSKLKEFAKRCLNFYKSNTEPNIEWNKQLRIFYRQERKDDLQFRHYFHVFLIQFQKCLIQTVLDESKDYIPRSDTFKDALSKDQYYNLYMDEKQLISIDKLIREIFYSISWEKFRYGA